MATKIKSKDQLLDFYNEELAWRRKEIIDIKNLLRSKKDSLECKVLCKASILIAYSHWEGFVKNTSIAYLQYIKFLSLPRNILAQDLVAALFLQVEGQSKLKQKIEELRRLLSNDALNIKFNPERLIDTESNLNSNVLDKIMFNIGTNSSLFDTKRLFIDSILLNNRNSFAHGDNKYTDYDTGKDIVDNVITLLGLYKSIIDNMVITDCYKK